MVEGPPPGSLRYFSILFAPANTHPLLEALYAFDATVREAVLSVAHEAAHTRLQWWRGELDRSLAGKPQHPITVVLAPAVAALPREASLLHETLTAADLDLAHMTYTDSRELDAYLFRASGSLQTIIACILAGPRECSASEREFARRLGSAVRQVEMLRDFEQDVRGGRLYIPLSELEAVGIDPADIARRLADRDLAMLLDRWARRVESELQSLPQGLSREERRTHRPGLVLGALHARLLHRLRASEPTQRGTILVPPLQRLWTAWRTALRYP